jgi:hypothetical protein
MRGFLLAACVVAGCTSAPALPGVAIDAGRSDAGPVLRFYLGSYMDPARIDSVLAADGDGWRLHLAVLAGIAPALHAALEPSAGDGLLGRDELRAAVQATYAEARRLPGSASELVALPGFGAPDDERVEIRVRGSMTRYERRVRIPVAAVVSALEGFVSSGELQYPVGTVVVGEHFEDGAVVETTAMIRRADGYWDFAAYGAGGAPIGEIHGDRGGLAVPTRCFGCHYGDRAFEPEASFPAPASDGPHGPRFVEVPGEWVDRDVVSRLDEHRRRSDGLLGLYATVLVGRWKAEAEAGRLPAETARLVEALGF